jgi:hypothetical protein
VNDKIAPKSNAIEVADPIALGEGKIPGCVKASVLGCFRVRTAGMQPNDSMGTRESRQVQAQLVRSNKPRKRGRPDGRTEVRLADITLRSGEPTTWGKRPAEVEPFGGNMGSIQRED